MTLAKSSGYSAGHVTSNFGLIKRVQQCTRPYSGGAVRSVRGVRREFEKRIRDLRTDFGLSSRAREDL